MEKDVVKNAAAQPSGSGSEPGGTGASREAAPKLDKKALVGDLVYGALKGIGGLAFKYLNKMEISGEENVPAVGKAILMTVSEDPVRDMVIVSNLTGRKIHFMLNPKLMKTPVVGPVLKTLGMFRSTTSKDDTEPIEKVFHYLNETNDLVAMTPE
ncbi:MAG: hypothetical protein ACTSU5_20935, partial [Promethearchaeota archaeon]